MAIKSNSLKATETQDMIYSLSSNLYWLVWIQCDKLDWVVTKIKTYNLKKKILPCSYCESKQQTPLNACPLLGLLCLYYNNMHIRRRKKILFYGHDQPIFSILGFFFFQFCQNLVKSAIFLTKILQILKINQKIFQKFLQKTSDFFFFFVKIFVFLGSFLPPEKKKKS